MNRMAGILATIGLVLLGIFGGIISGALIVYFLSAVSYQAVYSGATSPVILDANRYFELISSNSLRSVWAMNWEERQQSSTNVICFGLSDYSQKRPDPFVQ
jgi:hypothetical protein